VGWVIRGSDPSCGQILSKIVFIFVSFYTARGVEAGGEVFEV
jgi:hypothetical protein